MRIIAIASLLAAAFTVPANAETGFGEQIGQVGKWTVYADTNQMTDAKECTALFEDRAAVQYSGDSLAISLRGRGGIRAYTMRFDDNAALPLRLANEDEKGVQAAYFKGEDLANIEAADRLRIEIMTVIRGVVFEDIDLSGLPEVRTLFTTNGCSA